MGFMDKVKAQAEQAVAKAQQGMAQGQAKLDTIQAKRQADGLLRDLGAAYYAEQRQGGPHDAVEAVLGKLDEHVAANGAVDTAPTAPSPLSPPVPGTGGATAPPPAATQGDAAQSGSFSLDDL